MRSRPCSHRAASVVPGSVSGCVMPTTYTGVTGYDTDKAPTRRAAQGFPWRYLRSAKCLLPLYSGGTGARV